ncbi:abc transporter family protein [Stylonychia lemnae]|uniref:Abc transporter family protein n=1 Tax=Stylonychia lemnae TaxID=5949 RepID=A0A078BA97_STYLE|nr:abc transporter family protein [Stylonychia lemnae]|eukprot:CDW91455.1 abc transporter family protein [Stylonychia lemnae]
MLRQKSLKELVEQESVLQYPDISHWRQLKALTIKSYTIQYRLLISTLMQYMISFFSFIGSAVIYAIVFMKKDDSAGNTALNIDVQTVFILVVAIPFTLLTKNIFSQIINDKETNLVEVLKFNNLSPITYGLSFITQYIIYIVYTSLCLTLQFMVAYIVTGKDEIAEQKLGDFALYFFQLLLFAIGLVCFSLFLSVFFKDVKIGQLIGSQIFVFPIITFVILLQRDQIDDNQTNRTDFTDIFDYTQFLVFVPHYPIFMITYNLTWQFDHSSSIDQPRAITLSNVFLFVNIFLYFTLYVIFSGFSLSTIDKLKRKTIECRNLSLKYDDNFEAVKKVDFAIKRGELVCLIGPNGSGKSSLLNMICGLIQPTEGDIKIYGEILNKSNKRQVLDFCLQEDTLIQNYTVEEHFKIICDLKNIESDQEQKIVKEILICLNLEKHKDSYSQDLSLGNKRKLQMGMSLLGSKKVLILDEITSGLDIVSRKQIWDLVKELKHNKTIIFCTQHLQEADELADKILLLENGQVKYYGDPQNLNNHIGSKYTFTITIKDKTKKFKLVSLKRQLNDLKKLKDIEIQQHATRIKGQHQYLVDEKNLSKLEEVMLFLEHSQETFMYDLEKQNLESQYMSHLYSNEMFSIDRYSFKQKEQNLDLLNNEVSTSTYIQQMLKQRYNQFKRNKKLLIISLLTMLLAFASLIKLALTDQNKIKTVFIQAFEFGHGNVAGILVMQASMDYESKFRYLINLAGMDPQIYWLTNLLFDVLVYLLFAFVYFIITQVLFCMSLGDFFMIIIMYLLFGCQLVLLNYLISVRTASSNTAFSGAISFTLAIAIIFPIGTYYIAQATAYSNTGGFYQQGDFANIALVVLGLDPFVIFSGAFQTQIAYKEIQDQIPIQSLTASVSIFDLYSSPVFSLVYCMFFYKILVHSDSSRLRVFRKLHKKIFYLTLNPEETENIINIKDLEKSYKKKKPILKKLSLQLKTGEILGLLGPNGCGKSTMLSILALDQVRNDGEIVILGSWIDEFEPEIQGIDLGYCAQYNILKQKLTVDEHLDFISIVKGLTPDIIKSKKAWLLKALDLKKYQNKQAGNLSEGNKRKLCLAMTLMRQPRLLILDEPFTGVDPLGKKQIYQILRSLTDISIIFSTHSVDEAEALCDRIIIMNQGIIQEESTMLQVNQKFIRLYKFKITIKDISMAPQVRDTLQAELPQFEIEDQTQINGKIFSHEAVTITYCQSSAMQYNQFFDKILEAQEEERKSLDQQKQQNKIQLDTHEIEIEEEKKQLIEENVMTERTMSIINPSAKKSELINKYLLYKTLNSLKRQQLIENFQILRTSIEEVFTYENEESLKQMEKRNTIQ